jgi:hypothetical protein
MNSELLIFIVLVSGLTLGFLLLNKYILSKGIKTESINQVLDTTKLVSVFIKSILQTKEKYNTNIDMYSALLIEAIEYIKILSSNISKEEKIKEGMSGLVNIAENINIHLTDDEIFMLHDVLSLVYEFYLQIEKSKVK